MTRNNRKILSLVLFIVGILAFLGYYLVLDNEIKEPEEEIKKVGVNDLEGLDYPKFDDLGLTKANQYIISTSNKMASKVGAKILADGGNAIDAVIAAQMVLNVVEPHSSGIGGGAFLLYYDAKNRTMHYFNGRETAPRNAHSDMFLDANGKPKDFHDAVKGGLSVGTPGLLKMLKAVHDKYGKMPWKNLFEAAIRIAKEGFPVDEEIHQSITDLAYLKDFDDMSKTYLNANGKVKDVGTIITNEELAKTLEIIADKGIEPFYEGQIAKDMVDKIQTSAINPGYLSLADLKSYHIKEEALICGPYRRFRVCSVPIPSSGGITLLQILGILENFELKEYKPTSVEFVHLVSEATRLAYADRNKYIGDIPNIPLKRMLSKRYLKSRSQLILPDKAMETVVPGQFRPLIKYQINNNIMENPSTTHLSAIDKEGNAVSMTSSIEYLFGSGLMVDGFVLNNQLTDFSLAPKINGRDVANKVMPGKQPRSSMAPTFVFDENNNLVLVVGSPGGQRIIQYVLKVVIANLDFQMNVADAIALPNFVVIDDIIELEKGTDLEKIQADLIKMGHKIIVKNIVSGVNAININVNPKDVNIGRFMGGADFRRTGAAIGE